MSDDTRDRGILTEADRASLRGENDVDQSTERDIRMRIRDRTRNAIADFGLLLDNLEYRDRVQILNEFAYRHDEAHAKATGEERTQGPPELFFDIFYEPLAFWYGIYGGGLRHMQAFIILLLLDDFVGEQGVETSQIELLLETVFREGLKDAFGRNRSLVTATVDVDIEDYEMDADALSELFEHGPDAINDLGVEWLIHTGDIDPEEYLEYLEETRHSDESE